MKKIFLYLVLLTSFVQAQTVSNQTSATATTRQVLNVPRIAAFGSNLALGSALSDGVATTETSRNRYKSNGVVSSMQISWFNDVRPGNVTTGYNDVTLSASLEYPAGTFTRIYFNGNTTYTLRVGNDVLSDAVPIEIPAGVFFWIRTNVLVTSGQKWLKHMATSINLSEGTVTGSDLTMSGTIANSSSSVFGPNALIGVTNTRSASIALIGDSRTIGTGDSGFTPSSSSELGGNFGRAFPGGNFNVYRFNRAGDEASFFQSGNRRGNFKYISYCSHAIFELGVNDILTNGTSTTLAAIQAKALDVLENLYARNIVTYMTTITPYTNSTDGWTTTTGQTTRNPTREAVRIQYNTWIRDGAPMDISTRQPLAVGSATATTIRMGQTGHPVKSYFDIADVFETARNSGIINAGYTADGLHGNSTSYPLEAQLIINAINAGVFTIY